MLIALLATIVFGISSILLSLENDFLSKKSLKEKKEEEDRIYKLAVIEEIEEKIAYETDHEKVVDAIMASLRNIISYTAASSMVIKDTHLVFKTYVEEDIGPLYMSKVEENMITSLEKLMGRMPLTIDRKLYGDGMNNANTAVFLSSYHIPLIANNKVLALIHLSSTTENAFLDTKDLRELIDSASSALTHFNRAVGQETDRYSSLISSFSDGVFLTDNKNNLLVINDNAKKLLGISSNVNYFDVLDIVGQDAGLGNRINQVMLSKNPDYEKEVKVNEKILDIFISPVGEDKVSVILRDMTDFKRKEMEKEDLIHIMVHELRAPTTTIKDSAELIITSQDTFDEGRKLKFLEIIHSQAKKVLGQIGSILDTAKLDAGKLVLQKAPGDIAKLIQDEIQTFMPQAQKKNIALTFDLLAKSLPQISFDEIRISQVIDNLLSNALKFTPEGGNIKVQMDYKVVPPVLDGVSPMGDFLSLDKYITISVADSGVGISPEQQKVLFAKYTQAKNTSGQLPSMGTGLGLYLAKGIVEAHEGRIWIKSVPGQGTTFTFTLPAVGVVQPSYDAPKPTPTPLAKMSQTVN
jgi:signal transduction histidine kinase